uniref:Uncharacterized protein n=1 Tax=Noctiluca scintillans TaxID=2966 RepID=A0A7S1ADA0_NOCSC|mmetsp:Transcript_41703/g.110365  ORF Transcript_41703/g.110365 Transcript_41703/m.110365 type:complete len:135 (+) Transcript_41703:236-640(+)
MSCSSCKQNKRQKNKTYYVMRDKVIKATVRAKMITVHKRIHVYVGEEHFTYANYPKSQSTAILTIARSNALNSRSLVVTAGEDTSVLVARLRSEVDISYDVAFDEYTIEVERGVDVSLLVAVMLAVDDINEDIS